MWQTLFHIPHEKFGVPVFGVGWVLAAFVIASGIYLAVQIRQRGVDREVVNYLPVMLLVGLAIALVLPQLEEVIDGEPVGVAIRGYGVMVLLGIVAGVWLGAYRAQRMGIDPEIIFSLAFYVFLFGVIGARLFYIIQYWDEFQQETLAATIGAILKVTKGGLVVYGSLIGTIVAIAVFVQRRKVPCLALCDLIAPSLALGLTIGRIGCLMNGCCFGGSCDQAWALRFPPESPVYERQVYQGELMGFDFEPGQIAKGRIARVEPDSDAAKAGLRPGDKVGIKFHKDRNSISQGTNHKGNVDGTATHPLGGSPDAPPTNRPSPSESPDLRNNGKANPQAVVWINGVFEPIVFELPDRSLPVHPAQIYASFNAFVLFILFLAFYPFRQRDGALAALLLTVYPITRFLLEVIRIDEPLQGATGMTISQNVSVVMFVLGVILWIYVLRQPKGTVWPPAEITAGETQ